MFRILQGDVGSGKTIVSLLSLANVIESNYQCALMGPTEILANQHFHLAKKIFYCFPYGNFTKLPILMISLPHSSSNTRHACSKGTLLGGKGHVVFLNSIVK